MPEERKKETYAKKVERRKRMARKLFGCNDLPYPAMGITNSRNAFGPQIKKNKRDLNSHIQRRLEVLEKSRSYKRREDDYEHAQQLRDAAGALGQD